jgi:hypothetical protein
MNLVFDVDNAIAANGQPIKMWGRSNHAAQNFRFVDSSSQIKFAKDQNYCLDVWLGNGTYDNGDPITLYRCDGNKGNQKFVVFADGTIRPKNAQNMCLDIQGPLQAGGRVQIWGCFLQNGQNANQQFNAGEYDFDGQRFYMRIYASKTFSTGTYNLVGHVLVSTWRTGRGITNSFSFWPNKDTYYVNDWGRVNNIRTGNNINIDEGKNGADWNIAYWGNMSGYRIKDVEVSKSTYDEIKYMRGYTMYGWESIGYNVCSTNCATYSTALYNRYNGNSQDYSGYGYGPLSIYVKCDYPGQVYDKL